MGPVTKLQNVSWQTKDRTGYDTAQFQIDSAAKQATCPQGQTSVKWYDNVPDRTGNAGIQINFPAAACQACATRSACTRSAKGGRNTKPCGEPATSRLRQLSPVSTGPDWASKAPSHKAYAPLKCGPPVTSASPKPTSNPWLWPPQSTCAASSTT